MQFCAADGGEPLAQKNVFPFISELLDKGYEVLIETGGFVSTANVDERAKIILDVKCPASGEVERNYWANLERLRREKDEVKFVVANLKDWEFAREIIERPRSAHAASASQIHLGRGRSRSLKSEKVKR